jgi:hypothetical protein
MFNTKYTAKEIALRNINKFQNFIKRIKKQKERAIETLVNEGWKIEFGYQGELFDIGEDTVVCFATKEVGEDKIVQFKRKAKVEPEDIYLVELGEYLALSKVFIAIKGE